MLCLVTCVTVVGTGPLAASISRDAAVSVEADTHYDDPKGDRAPRGREGDGWADVVIGQPSFTEVTPYAVVPHKLFNPAGLAVAPAPDGPGRLYVWDSGNSRVLGIDLGGCYASGPPCAADVVIGQPGGYGASACNGDSGFSSAPERAQAGPDTLCGVPEDAISILEHKSAVALGVGADGALYVPDFYNHRVLRFDDPFASDLTADDVWGQASFTANHCNRDGLVGPATLCFASRYADGAGAAVDTLGNLWVADGGNNRILRFSVGASGRPDSMPDLVLGQSRFDSADPGVGLANLSSPASARVGPDGRVWVADRGNDRVLVFTPPLTSGMRGVRFGHGFADPLHVEPDPIQPGTWVYDAGNGMYERWDATGGQVEVVVGKPEYQPDGTCLGALCPGAGSFGFDTAGDLLVSAYGHVQDVIRFERGRLEPGTVAETGRLFSPPGGYNESFGGLTSELGPIGGLAVGANQLVVAEGRRMLFWDGLGSLVSGQEASGLIQAADFGSVDPWQGRMATDDSNRLWSLRAEGTFLFALPLRADSRPLARILPPGEPIPVLGGGHLFLGRIIHGLAVTVGARSLWLAEPEQHRVIRVRDPLTAPVVDVILGQTGPEGGTCNRGIERPPKDSGLEVRRHDVLCHPGSVALDGHGNVYVGDHTIEAEGNWRQLVFLRDTVPEGVDRLITAPVADREFPYFNLQPGAMFEPAFDAGGRMIVGFNRYVMGRAERTGRKVGVYLDPLAANSLPDGHLEDIVSLPWSVKVDGVGDVYVADSNRHRVLVYRRPFAADGEAYLPLVVRHR